MKQPVTIFWFRRDLRLQDTCGLSAALSGNYPVVPIFIFDTAILDQLSAEDARVTFIHRQLNRLNSELAKYHTSLLTYYGTVQSALEKVCARFIVKSVYCNHDYEPYARKRDSSTKKWLGARGVDFRSFKDQVIYEKNEVLKQDGAPYTVFTAYMKKWKSTLNTEPGILEPNKLVSNFVAIEPQPMVSLKSLGFNKQVLNFPPANEPVESTISRYSENRDFPAKQGTTRLSVHLRFGTVSIRSLVRIALNQSETWLNELIWREFYMMILWHFPYVVDGCFRKEYDFIPWKNNEQEFERWCNGETGYPFVDAGMRELNETGFMHNRLRMVTASFLSKHLLINWQWGEAYFAEKLLDFELSSNNGGWQWSAGCGCDAAPYFRIFNPRLQAKKFDPESTYINKWIKNLNQAGYPQPIIDHEFARNRALKTYRQTLDYHRV